MHVTAVPTHVPAEQRSPVVQALPSVQELVLLTCWQTPLLHESEVHALASSQSALVTH